MFTTHRDIVDAAHLRPLEKSRNTVGAKPATSWNPLVSQQSKSFNCKNVDNNKNEVGFIHERLKEDSRSC